MKTVKIKAYSGNGEKKQFEGEQEALQPETMEELTESFEESYILAKFWTAHVIAVQAELRRKPSNSNVSKFKRLAPEEQVKLLNSLGL